MHRADIDEALRLIYASKESLTEPHGDRARARNPIDEIFSIFQQLNDANGGKPISFANAGAALPC